MNVLCGIKVNSFYCLVEQLCGLVGVKNINHWHSKRMYGNIKLTYLVCKKEQLNVSYRRFAEICEEDGAQRMLCLKRIPHFTTLQKFVQRTSKEIFEKLVRACRTILGLKDITAAIDGTGFSNTNPSQYYQKRINSKPVKNYTKTIFLADIKNNIILDVKTTSDNTHETNYFKPMITQLAKYLKTVLADKAYDSMSNRKLCWKHNIQVHIPLKEHKWTRNKYGNKPHHSAERRRALKKFNQTKYKQRAFIESINSAIKQTLGAYTRARKSTQQQKNITIKALTYNIEHIGRKLKITIKIQTQ